MDIQTKQIILDALEDIENKYLERGSFTRYFDEIFDLSIVLSQPEGDDGNFEIHIRFDTEGDANIDEDEAEQLSDMVDDDFYILLSDRLSEEQVDSIRENYGGKSLFLNGNLIY